MGRTVAATRVVWGSTLLAAALAAVLFGLVAAAAAPSSESELEGLIRNKLTEAHLPGLAAVIVKHGRVVWQQNFGFADLAAQRPVTGNTVFRVASVSKTFTAVALMQLVEQGRFRLDDDISSGLPFRLRHPNFPNQAITYRMLLTHTAGIVDNFTVLDPYWNWDGDSTLSLAALIQAYFAPTGSLYSPDNFLPAGPMVSAEYSSMGIALAGYLVERWSGKPFAQAVTAGIFQPLGLASASWYTQGFQPAAGMATPYEWQGQAFAPLAQYGYPDVPAGTLRLSANALARFLTALTGDGQRGAARLLRPESLAEMRRVQLPQIADDQALVFYYTDAPDGSGRRLIGHNGGDPGITAEMYWVEGDPDGLGFILLANSDATLDDDRAGAQRAAAFESIIGQLLRYGAEL